MNKDVFLCETTGEMNTNEPPSGIRGSEPRLTQFCVYILSEGAARRSHVTFMFIWHKKNQNYQQFRGTPRSHVLASNKNNNVSVLQSCRFFPCLKKFTDILFTRYCHCHCFKE